MQKRLAFIASAREAGSSNGEVVAGALCTSRAVCQSALKLWDAHRVSLPWAAWEVESAHLCQNLCIQLPQGRVLVEIGGVLTEIVCEYAAPPLPPSVPPSCL